MESLFVLALRWELPSATGFARSDRTMNPRTPLLRAIIRSLRASAAHTSHTSQTPQPCSGADEESDALSRRSFLKSTGLVAGGVALTSLQGIGWAKEPTATPPKTVAILGGGASGLTAAYRLMQAGVKVVLFEADKRLGGRMHTLNDFVPAKLNDGNPMFCELGGELVDTDHEDLITLAKELGVEIQDLRVGVKGVDYYHIGGKTMTDADMIPAFEPLAKQLAEDADGLEDNDGNFTEKATSLDSVSIADYLKRFEGTVDAWVLKTLHVAYEIEYGLDPALQSALNLITYLSPDTSNGFKMFGDSDEAWRIRGGSSRLIEALAKAIEGKVTVKLRHRLRAIKVAKKDGEASIALSFETAEGKTKVERFSKVICALPFTVLRAGRVQGLKDLGLSEQKLAAIETLGYGNNTKAMIAFKGRQWQKSEPVSSGTVFTDLSFQCCWETSRGQDGAAGILTNFLAGTTALEASPKTRFDQTLKELDTVFPGIAADALGKRVMSHWPTVKTMLGAYTCPLVGQFTAMLEHCATPELDGALLFAGEHTSGEYSGYMNGAIESGNRVAMEIVGAAKEA